MESHHRRFSVRVEYERRASLHPSAARFIAEFESYTFNHSARLFAGLASGTVCLDDVVETSSQLASALLLIYDARLNRLNKRFPGKATSHVESLRVDTTELCNGLRRCQDEPCDFWTLTEEPYYNYSVFVARMSRTILGCIRAVDNRLLTEEARFTLWGDLKPNTNNAAE